ncbi:unnamed protein product [Cuscuta europaea]|uniref:Uncharacterized protein n=1 Tax=Cuscuta europaea TaxID=41803 RepID=A0A9P0YSU9_CUSEU|nr:unnamed protein product [Cuscuta europaea]
MALLSLSLTSYPTSAVLSSSSLSGGAVIFPQPQACAYLMPPPPLRLANNAVWLNRRNSQVVRMAPEEEKLTRRSPLDFPMEWERPRPGHRPDIFPQFSPMKTPLPPPLPADPPPEEDEEEEERQEEEEEEEKEGDEETEKEEPDLPERTQ